MKTCTIYGDLSSDSAADQYPQVAVCDKCVDEEQARGEDSQIVSVQEYDESLGDECEFCGMTAAEEAGEEDE